jgi:putative ABC transport system permease protein
MTTLWQGVRYGVRMLVRNPGFTAVVVVILAVGIGANTAIFSVVNATLLRPLPYLHPEQLVQVKQYQLGLSILLGVVGVTGDVIQARSD